jgi:very-short-patch-repair endonuclease
MAAEPFRGSVAVAAGVQTWGVLRGPRFRRLFPDVYLQAGVPLDLRTRSRAAYLLVGDRGALGGFSAAELHGAACAPLDAPAEVVIPAGDLRTRPGLLVRRDALASGEVCELGDLRVTVLDLARRYPRARGRTQLRRVVDLSEPNAESAMETRLRLLLVLAGLPQPVVQHPVAGGWAWLDLAYPQARLGVEYDGRYHLDPGQFSRDLRRRDRLAELGWRVIPVTSVDVYRRPKQTVDRVRRALTAGISVGRRMRRTTA